MNNLKVYTAECYRYSTDEKRSIRLLNGDTERNRDNFTPVMIWTKEYIFLDRAEGIKKLRSIAKELSAKGKEKYRFVV